MSFPIHNFSLQSDNPLLGFIPLIDLTISEMLSHDGLTHQVCCRCQADLRNVPSFRCRDCFSQESLCKSCIVGAHSGNPLHRVEVSHFLYPTINTSAYRIIKEWNGSFYCKIDLKALGVRIQLLHEDCPRPHRAFNDDFVIIDSNGIHCVGLDFCNCAYAPSHYIQLLRHRLLPATTADPKTAATFGVLETFQMLLFTAKVNVHDFMQALVRRTDNTGDANVPVSVQLLATIRPVKWDDRIATLLCYGWSTSGGTSSVSGSCTNCFWQSTRTSALNGRMSRPTRTIPASIAGTPMLLPRPNSKSSSKPLGTWWLQETIKAPVITTTPSNLPISEVRGGLLRVE
jgi:CxC2 like cysteine cluster associated with KDZ transposases